MNHVHSGKSANRNRPTLPLTFLLVLPLLASLCLLTVLSSSIHANGRQMNQQHGPHLDSAIQTALLEPTQINTYQIYLPVVALGSVPASAVIPTPASDASPIFPTGNRVVIAEYPEISRESEPAANNPALGEGQTRVVYQLVNNTGSDIPRMELELDITARLGQVMPIGITTDSDGIFAGRVETQDNDEQSEVTCQFSIVEGQSVAVDAVLEMACIYEATADAEVTEREEIRPEPLAEDRNYNQIHDSLERTIAATELLTVDVVVLFDRDLTDEDLSLFAEFDGLVHYEIPVLSAFAGTLPISNVYAYREAAIDLALIEPDTPSRYRANTMRISSP
ncbi:MAG: hypothetical protein AAF639_29745 [Chloroflexota bacterium]